MIKIAQELEFKENHAVVQCVYGNDYDKKRDRIRKVITKGDFIIRAIRLK